MRKLKTRPAVSASEISQHRAYAVNGSACPARCRICRKVLTGHVRGSLPVRLDRPESRKP